MRLAALLAVALGAEPEVRVLDDRQTVEGVVEVDVPPERVLEVLHDPVLGTAALGEKGERVRVLGRDGPCAVVEHFVPDDLMSVRYVARECPSVHGVVEELVESDDLAELLARWEVEPTEDGRTRIRFRLRTRPRLPVPSFLLRREVVEGVRATLERARRFFGG